jgi:hypothetical protein
MVKDVDGNNPNRQQVPQDQHPGTWHYEREVRENEMGEYEQLLRYRDQQYLYSDPLTKRTWKAANQFASLVTREIILEVWKKGLEVVDLRANWLDLCQTVSVKLNCCCNAC